MIKTWEKRDIEAIVALQLKQHHLSPQLQTHLCGIYSALLDSPLITVQVLEKQNEIVGYAIATNDSKRLPSDIFSRMPLKAVKMLIRYPVIAKQLRSLFRSRLQRHNCDAEILDFYATEGQADPAELTELLNAALEKLAQMGCSSVASAPLNAPELMQALKSCDFQAAEREGNVIALPSNEVWQRELCACADYVPGPFTMRDRLRCLWRFEFMIILPLYCLIHIPFASYLAYWGTRLDSRLGLPQVLPYPWNIAVMIALLIIGAILLFISYSYLILEGEGGPVPPYSSKTRRLVTTGPYAYVRHPSIIAKLIGVIGLGFGFNSWCFLLVIIPILLCWSYCWNRHRQDTDLVKVFGEEYLRYRREVPMLIPRWKK
ncbi:isoprenylcysteine carboxylmethyltransferase family protein [bacterium]|nr:isoprenylcysteine carboxylmethyltransferase family protein [bacterium]